MTKKELKMKWQNQKAHCACGDGFSLGRTIHGTVSGFPATWHECDTCTGTAIGWAYVPARDAEPAPQAPRNERGKQCLNDSIT